jgi:hypothetical protein
MIVASITAISLVPPQFAADTSKLVVVSVVEGQQPATIDRLLGLNKLRHREFSPEN